MAGHFLIRADEVFCGRHVLHSAIANWLRARSDRLEMLAVIGVVVTCVSAAPPATHPSCWARSRRRIAVFSRNQCFLQPNQAQVLADGDQLRSVIFGSTMEARRAGT